MPRPKTHETFTLHSHKSRSLVRVSTSYTSIPYPMLTVPIHNISMHLIKWVTKNNCPFNIINGCELQNLLMAGWRNIELPSNITILWDIHALFLKCQDCITKLLQDHPGLLYFATDAWTSPNHHSFLMWTVHLEYKWEMLSFLIDVIEVPEVCTWLQSWY